MECRGFESHPRQLIILRKSDCLGCAVLLCLVCLFDLACFFLSSFSSLIKNTYIMCMCMHALVLYVCTCMCVRIHTCIHTYYAPVKYLVTLFPRFNPNSASLIPASGSCIALTISLQLVHQLQSLHQLICKYVAILL